ncbi:energy transducer TonB [Marinoscillum sp. MHG1-6]|uniref:energy transducer TonB n=1 Tax=Marinoscillum sp. MHG1-6 TaxID=2959627 RepID=UPI002157D5D3|nr:energy transducer TonB [Marinoscillum sp. MHG1-6]
MRTLSILFALVIGMSTAFANSGEDAVARTAKATNFSEVINKIEYPQTARTNGIEGRVLVLVKINEEGKVATTKVVSSPSEELSKAVITAMKKLQFEPAKNANGVAVPSAVHVPVDFELTID